MKNYLLKRQNFYFFNGNWGLSCSFLLMLSVVSLFVFLSNFNHFEDKVANVNNQKYQEIQTLIDAKQKQINQLNHELNELKDKKSHYEN